MIKFVDLFAGIGGIRKGLEISLSKHNYKFKCVFSSEIHEKSKYTYSKNYNTIPEGDIKLVEKLPAHDILLAGFPCQAFSYAGKQKGFADTRGTLFFEIERLLTSTSKKPKLLLLENVRGFTSHDNGRTCKTVLEKLHGLGYATKMLILNSSNFNVPQNRVRAYIVCTLNSLPKMTIETDLGATDSHNFKARGLQLELFRKSQSIQPTSFNTVVKDILEENIKDKYLCSSTFTEMLKKALNGKPMDSLHGVRLIDTRGGNSIHSWDLGLRGKCSQKERSLMNAIIENRRKKHFGTHQDGKELDVDQIRTFFGDSNLLEMLEKLVNKGYLRVNDGRYNTTCGNMSLEVFKFLDPESI
jgi:DNA (cytosine-5)-methyltransferase 1